MNKWIDGNDIKPIRKHCDHVVRKDEFGEVGSAADYFAKDDMLCHHVSSQSQYKQADW